MKDGLPVHSSMAQDGIGQVRFFQVLGLFLRQFDIESLCSLNQHSKRVVMGGIPLTNHLSQVFNLGGPDNWSGDSLEAPGDGNLSHLDALLLGYLLDTDKK